MRGWGKHFLVALGVVMSVGAGVAQAEDPLAVGPDVYSLKFENERVRILEISFQPGQSIAMHSHPDHAVYVLAPGTLQLTHPDGSVMDFVGEEGQVVWIPAESHSAVNTGATEMRAVVIELK